MTEAKVDQLKYLRLLSQQFPTQQAVFTEIINLQAILNLPKATEHFMSDVHGESDAFTHILNNCSGVIRERVAATFEGVLDDAQPAELCTLIYYPREKLELMRAQHRDTTEWYRNTLHNLVRIARFLSNNYTRSKVRKAMPVAYAYIIDELLHEAGHKNQSRHSYHVRIIDSIIETGSAEDFICSLSALIKRLAVDRLHIVGDIFDRGPHADRIMDDLLGYHCVDVQWGNHDVLWMGAAAGSPACIATVVRNNVRYGQLEVLESAYGISLRELALFAERAYGQSGDAKSMERAISVILLKLEGRTIMRHPEFSMNDRLLLDRMDLEYGTVRLGDTDYPLVTTDFPTLDPQHPYELTPEESEVMNGLVKSFRESVRLQRHMDFLIDHGSVYLVHDGNLIFHGCIPMNEDGTFRMVRCGDAPRSGKAYMDFCDHVVRRAWNLRQQSDLDWMWYLWCGKQSPMSGRIVKTFERICVADPSTWVEPRDPYWRLTRNEEACVDILHEFGLSGKGHIINGHTPIKIRAGEKPIRGGGRLLVIDGGFCKAYHATTGIAGFTLVVDDCGMKLRAHRPFESVAAALTENADITSVTTVVEREDRPLLISDTDTGRNIRSQIADLKALLEAYRMGELKEH